MPKSELIIQRIIQKIIPENRLEIINPSTALSVINSTNKLINADISQNVRKLIGKVIKRSTDPTVALTIPSTRATMIAGHKPFTVTPGVR